MTRPVALLVLQAAVVLAILACVLVLVARSSWRLDLTPERRFTLSPHTREVLHRLEGKGRISVTAFYSAQEAVIRREMADLLALLTDAAPWLEVRLLDLDRSPGAAERLGVRNYNVAVVEAPGRDGAVRREQVTLVNEETLTAALLEAAGMPTLPTYFLLGHGERDPRDEEGRDGAGDAARALELDGFDVRTLSGAAAVPDDAALVVVAGATRDLRPPEVNALSAFVRGGGRLLVLTDPGTPASVERLLAGFGIEPGNDVVVDVQARLFGTDGLAARIAYLNQQVVPELPEVQALLPVAQTLRLVETPGVRADYLAVTSEGTWADVDRRALGGEIPELRRGVDRSGPLPVAALARVPADDGLEGRVMAVGDADFVSNLHLGVLGNRDLLLLLAELTARDRAIAAPRRPPTPQGRFSALFLTAREAQLVFWLAVAGPGTAFALAAVAAARRRRRG